MKKKEKQSISSLKKLKCTNCKSKDVIIKRVTSDELEVIEHKTIWFECLYCGLNGNILYIKDKK